MTTSPEPDRSDVDPALAGDAPLHDAAVAASISGAEALHLSLPALAPRLRSGTATTVMATLAVIAALWWGQRFVVPLAAALMLAMMLAPCTAWLGHWLRSQVLAALVALSLAVATIGLGVGAFSGQLIRVAERAPEMISLAADQLAHNKPNADSLLQRGHKALQELDAAAGQLSGNNARTRKRMATPAAATAPISEGATVVLRDTAVSGSSLLLKFLSDLTIILFISFFLLAGGRPLTERLLDQWSYHPQAHALARKTLLECGRQIRLYMGVLLVTNTVIGFAVWVAFSIAGLPDAGGWGVTAGVLHVIPYLGMALLTALAGAESFLAHGSLAAAFSMAGFIVVLSTLVGTLMTAWLQGHAAKMNPAAVFIGVVFWGALWGVWGLFLGPALVVLFKVVAEHSRWGHRLARLMQG